VSQTGFDRLQEVQEENRQLRADLAESRLCAQTLMESREEERAISRQLSGEIAQLRADLADAKGAAAGAREDAERFRAERDARSVNACAHDIERERACDLTAHDLGRVLLWAAAVAIERDELRARSSS